MQDCKKTVIDEGAPGNRGVFLFLPKGALTHHRCAAVVSPAGLVRSLRRGVRCGVYGRLAADTFKYASYAAYSKVSAASRDFLRQVTGDGAAIGRETTERWTKVNAYGNLPSGSKSRE